MALKRKKKENEVLCYYCKETKTNFTVHGGYVRGGGKRCCDRCMAVLRNKDKKMQAESHDPSLGEEQAYKDFGL